MDGLQSKLEEIKRQGNYSMVICYGEDVGCDDISEAPEDRSIRVYTWPVGVLGEAKKAWVFEKVSDFLSSDVAQQPTVVYNPPDRDTFRTPGVYLWGTEAAIKTLTGE